MADRLRKRALLSTAAARVAMSSLAALGAAAIAPGALAAAQDPAACCTPTSADWPKNGGNLGNQSSTALKQITTSNIRNLGPAWVVHASPEPVTSPVAGPGGAQTGQQTTPVVVDGVLYVDTPAGGVMAVDGATGAVKWKWQPSEATGGFAPSTTRRGVSVGEGKVYTLAGGNRVVALDKETGRQVWAVQPTAKGETLGNTSKVATIYHDGMVYVGTNDSPRSAAYALRASDGAIQWWFYAAYPHGTVFTDVNGKTFDAGDSWTTKAAANDTPNDCYRQAGGAPWMHPAIDPELGMVYFTFGNARICGSSQDGSGRPGDNLFTNSVVAIDAKSGQYKWHFQSVHHDIWDMDNVHAPLLADTRVAGQRKKLIYYGSKQGHIFVLDRTNGRPVLGVEERPVSVDSRQNNSRTQPYPAQGPFIPQCLAYQNLGSDIPGLPHRAPPNYNGYQAEPDPGRPGQLRLVLRPGNYLEADAPFLSGPPRKGCMNEAHWEAPVLSVPSQNGGADWSNYAYSAALNTFYVPYSTNAGAHARNLFQGGNGMRAPGVYQSGGIVAIDASTNRVKWRKEMGPGQDIAHGNSPLVTASNLLFFGRPDGWLIAMDAATGDEVWRFQTGAASASGVIAYTVNGEQYIATAAMGGNQPYGVVTEGDAVWAFKLGGKAVYTTGPKSAPVVVSGSSEAPSPAPLVNLRRPVDNTPAEGVPPNTIYLAWEPAGSTLRGLGASGRDTRVSPTPIKDSTATASMRPSRLTVPVGTTVTFTNPGDAQVGAGNGNLKEHCATQFFEGRFNFRLQPGQSAQHTFDREGEYYFNDCTDPRPTGKVTVTLAPQQAPVRFASDALDFRARTGVFTGVTGQVQAEMTVPAGWTLDRSVPVTVTGPLSSQPFTAVRTSTASNGTRLLATFNKADIDNNVPVGAAVPVKVSANFMAGGVQKKLEGTATVRVVK